jgi:arylformamidase
MPAWDRFPENFSYFHPGAIDHLAALGVVLIGIDTPSVDALASKDLMAHHAFLRHQIRNLEGLWMPEVKPGIYELCALPLRLTDADASPVRAVLREI